MRKQVQSGRWLRAGGGLAVGALCLWLSLRSARLDAVLGELANLSLLWVSLSLAGVIVVSAAKALRWQRLYPPSTPPLAWTTHFGILMIGQMLTLLAPVRLGEVTRLGLMRQEGRPLSLTLGSIVVEKSLDLLTVQAALLLAVPLAILPDWARARAGVGALAVGLGLPLVLLIMVQARGIVAALLARIPRPRNTILARWLGRALGLTQATLDGMAALGGRRLVGLLALSTGIWLLALVVIQMMLAAFALPVDWGAALILMLALTFSNWIPTPPGMIGVVGAVTVAALTPFGVTPARALALGTVLNGVLVGPPVLLGAWAAWLRLWRLRTAPGATRMRAALGLGTPLEPVRPAVQETDKE